MAQIKDIQVGDIISPFIKEYDAYTEVKILYIPMDPGVPWVVQELDNKRKWRLWTSGPMTRTMQRNTYE